VIFEMLSPMCQTYVLRLLCMQVGMPTEDIHKWCLPSQRKKHNESLKTLASLKILISDKHKNILLHKKFRTSLQKALCANESPFVQSEDKVSVADIVNHANKKWDTVLNAIVPNQDDMNDDEYEEEEEEEEESASRKRKRGEERLSDSSDRKNKLLNRLLLDTNMLRQGSNGRNEITKVGYEFMLMGRHMQAWRFVRAHLNGLDEEARIRLLIFIFRLRFCKLGQGYEVKNLTSDFKAVLKQFNELGLLLFSSKLKRFYPTQLAIDLISRRRCVIRDEQKKSSTTKPVFQVIVETNFHVTAYTSSPLHIRMLALFVDLHTRLPNMVHGTITRHSVSSALRKGVGARHMKAFLELYAHPSASKELPIIPTNIVDQLFLWEQDQNRVTFESGSLLRNFKTDSNYKAYARVAHEEGYLLFRNDAKRVLVVVPDGLQTVIEAVRRGGR
jgi:transcription initiation factor TFIIH subunit 4